MLITSLSFIIIILFFWIWQLKTDIRRRKKLEEEFENRKKNFEKLFELAPIFIDSFNPDGECLLWNKKCESVFGWSKDELNAQEDVFALFHPDPKEREYMKTGFASLKDTYYIEMSPLSRDGEEIHSRWINVNLSEDEIVYFGIDIRAQKEAEKKLLDAQSQLQELNNSLQDRVEKGIHEIRKKEQLLLQQSRFAQMGEMLSIIAHQWRQPLSVIGMSTFDIQNKMALKKFDFDNKESQIKFLEFLKKEMSDIDKYTQYLTRTIEDFTNFFKPNKEKEPTLLCVPIDKALNILDSMIKKEDIKLTVNMQCSKSINIYISEMMQVILNIIKNSIDNFIEKKSRNPQINITIQEENNKFIIKICDNGGGIDETILPNIFNPYFSTKSDKNGTGLGLYISKIVIENHSGGKLNVKNTNKGACFEIVLFGEN